MDEFISREAVKELLLSYSPAENGDINDLSEEEQACMFMLGDILSELEDIETEVCPNCGYKLDGGEC